MKSLLYALILLFCYDSYGQQLHYNQRPEFLKANRVWAFGNYGGLDFNNGGPTSMSTSMISSSGFASVADPETGKLLFYSNGDKIWNANHQLMNNGQDLLNNPIYQTLQCVCIVPVINAPGKYYVFSLNGEYSGGSTLKEGTLFYSVVDMSLDNGMGSVVAGQKKVLLSSDTISSAMIAIPGNCGDLWLMVHSYSTFKFMAYHITKDGVAVKPVLSNDLSNITRNRAALAVSPDRQKIAIIDIGENNATLIGRFDVGTGKVSDVIRIGGSAGYCYGVCFSPDNSKLYLTSPGRSSVIYQYDLSVYNPNDITLSEKPVATLSPGHLYALKLYNDTMYTYPVGVGLSVNRINKPNLAGAACDYQNNAISLIGDTIVLGLSFNNEVALPLPLDTTFSVALDSVVCANEFVLNAPAGFEAYEWEDGSTSPQRTIKAAGRFWVASKDICLPRVDTFIVAGVGFKAPVISANVYEMSVPAAYSTYQWLLDGVPIAGATTNAFMALKNGEYQVIVRSKDGCEDTSAPQAITGIEGTSISVSSTLTTEVSIYPNPASEVLNISASIAVDVVLSSLVGRVIKQEQQVRKVDLHGLSNGVYLLHIKDRMGNFIKVEKIVKQ